jgi:subtilase family serine protease
MAGSHVLSAPAPGGRRWLTLAVAALGVTLMAAPLASLGVSYAASSDSAGVTYYAISKPICKPPKPGHSSCFAMRRVEVKRGTPGARPYELAAGARRSTVKSGPAATIGPAGGLTPSDLATAYAFNSTATGTGQTVAIVDAYNDPNINADLQTFDTQYGLLTCSTSNGCLRVVNQTGGATPPANDTTGWSVEESLDVETVHSVCQNCKILLVEASSSSNANLEAGVNEAVTLKASEISNSYGGPESGSTAADEAAYHHPGIVITASAGDDGYYDFDLLGSGTPSPYNQANAPASYNSVVAVGGTSLYLGQTAARQSESVWNDNGPRDFWEYNFGQPLGAGGGGCSTLIPAQSWQSHLSVWASTACGTHRLVSDIAADADPLTGFDVYDSYNCGADCSPAPSWFTLGGTSLASPIIASMFALAGGAHGVSYPALTLYGHLGSSALYDVTSGGNGYCDGEGAAACGNPNSLGAGILDCDYPATGGTPSVGDRACDALAGYDGPTGVGTPNGLTAFAKTGPKAKISGPTSVVHAVTETWRATTTDPFPGGAVTSYRWNWGDGTAVSVTTSASATHHYAAKGLTRTITLTVTDNYGQTGTATYTVKVT